MFNVFVSMTDKTGYYKALKDNFDHHQKGGDCWTFKDLMLHLMNMKIVDFDDDSRTQRLRVLKTCFVV